MMDESLRSYTRIQLSTLDGPNDSATVELLADLAKSRMKDLNIFRILSVHPVLLTRFADLGAQLSSGVLPPRIREMAILRTAALSASAYEWEQHLFRARRAGLSESEIAAIASGEAFKWAELEASTMMASSELVSEGSLSDVTWARLQLLFNDVELVELVVLISFYISVARIASGLAIPVEDPA
jgi:4-carboxymuconolactone decarboxylase